MLEAQLESVALQPVLKEIPLKLALEHYFGKELAERAENLVEFLQPTADTRGNVIALATKFKLQFEGLVTPFLNAAAQEESSTAELNRVKTELGNLLADYEAQIQKLSSATSRGAAN